MKKTVFITGGSRGIGAACVRKFAGEGWQTAFIYEKNDEAAKAVAAETCALAIRCDVSDPEAVAKAVRDAGIFFGKRAFDALVCAAGIVHEGLFTDAGFDDYRRITDVNLGGTVNAAKAVSPNMIEAGSGSIVTVSSMWGETGASCEALYSASKGAVIALTKSLAKELGPSGVRVNCVSPGVIDTDMNKGYSEETMKELAEETPLGRIGRPEEVAEAIYFLAGDKASFITGQVLSVNGGFLI